MPGKLGAGLLLLARLAGGDTLAALFCGNRAGWAWSRAQILLHCRGSSEARIRSWSMPLASELAWNQHTVSHGGKLDGQTDRLTDEGV